MSYGYQDQDMSNWDRVSVSALDARVTFIRKTYAHLLFAILAFVGIEVALFSTGLIVPLTQAVLSVSWLVVLLAFMGVSWLADWWAQQDSNRGMQYMGLLLYTVAEAVIFAPLLYIASMQTSTTGAPDFSLITSAGLMTGLVFAGLTVSVFMTKKDFSWMRSGLVVATMAVIGLVFGAILFGFTLGLLFSVGMVILASAYILYQTSNILHHYHTEQYVAASLALFSSVGLLFWYILRIFMFARD